MKIRHADVDALARTLWGETRGEPLEGKLAVAHVVLNRLKRPGWWTRQGGDGIPDDTVEAACRDPWQFSCWNRGDPNRAKLLAVDLSDRAFRDSLYAALAVLQGHVRDPTGGATHYHADHITPPLWARGTRPSVRIGRHLFFDNVE